MDGGDSAMTNEVRFPVLKYWCAKIILKIKLFMLFLALRELVLPVYITSFHVIGCRISDNPRCFSVFQQFLQLERI